MKFLNTVEGGGEPLIFVSLMENRKLISNITAEILASMFLFHRFLFYILLSGGGGIISAFNF